MPAEIRPARASDIDALVAIENAVFSGDRMSRASLRRLIGSASAAIVVALGEGGIDGYCAVFFRAHAKVARLYSIAVRPGAKGLGRTLLEAAERTAATRDARYLRLEVRADNARAIALYEMNGYARFGVVEDYYQDGATALRYQKRLEGMKPPVAPKAPAEAGRHIAQ